MAHLAGKVGHSDSRISGLEEGQHVPDLETVSYRFIPALGLQNDPPWPARICHRRAGWNHCCPSTATAIRSRLAPATLAADHPQSD